MTIETYNSPPFADDDYYMPAHDTTLNQSASGGLLENDWDYDPADGLTVSWYSAPTSGATLSLNPDGSFIYTPPASWAGMDSFTYQVSDGIDQSNTATVTIDVMNQAPVAVQDGPYSVIADIVLTVVADEGVRDNDWDPDGDSLTVELSADATYGEVSLDPDGSFTYTPTVEYVGWDQFTYFAFDGIAQSAIMTVMVARNDIILERGEWDAGAQGYVFTPRGNGIEERWVGEHVALGATPVGPMPPAIASDSWSAQGAHVRDFFVEPQYQRYGRVRSHTPEEYASSGLQLFWHEDSGAGTFSVTDTVTLVGGAQVTRSAEYSVKSPSGTIQVSDNTNNISYDIRDTTTEYRLGSAANPAVVFNATQTAGPAGALTWTQLIGWNTHAYFDEDPGADYASPSVGSGEYTFSAGGLDLMNEVASPFTDAPMDAPPNHVVGPTGHVFTDVQFQTYLMWKSSRQDSIQVSLRRINWSFEYSAGVIVDAAVPLGWSWGPVLANTSSVSPPVVETSFPEWETRVDVQANYAYHSYAAL